MTLDHLLYHVLKSFNINESRARIKILRITDVASGEMTESRIVRTLRSIRIDTTDNPGSNDEFSRSNYPVYMTLL